MKKLLIITGLAIVLTSSVAFTAKAAPITAADLFLIVQKVISKFEIAINKINNNLHAQVIHVNLVDQDCTTTRTSDTEIGWCPDGIRSSFSITDPRFIPNNSVITAQAYSVGSVSVAKIDNCTYRAVTGLDTATPLVRLVCEFPPNNGDSLNYSIINSAQ